MSAKCLYSGSTQRAQIKEKILQVCSWLHCSIVVNHVDVTLPALVKSTSNFGRVAENRRVCLKKEK